MKKVVGILLAVFLCLGIAAPSMAMYDNGGVGTCKFVMIFAGAWLCTNTAAESDAYSMQSNFGTVDSAYYYGCRRHIDKPDSYAKIEDDSIQGNDGVVGVNNASGNFNNQGNTVAAAFAGSETYQGEAALAHAVACAFQSNMQNLYFSMKKEVNAKIYDSIYDNTGIVGVNNAGGSQNNQTNTVALAVGLDTGIALSEAALAQTNMCGAVTVIGGENNAKISGSIYGNTGIVGVNNSAGAQNNQANVVAISGNPQN